MKAWQLIADPSRFCQGAVARDAHGQSCGTGPDAKPVQFDCLGALWWTYDGKLRGEDRRVIGERLFDLCQARHGHRSPGRLSHDEAVVLLREVET